MLTDDQLELIERRFKLWAPKWGMSSPQRRQRIDDMRELLNEVKALRVNKHEVRIENVQERLTANARKVEERVAATLAKFGGAK